MKGMCGRYWIYEEKNEELREILDRTEGEFKIGEIFPTDKAPILIQQNGITTPQAVIWGFPGFRGTGVIINARAETVPEKAMFRQSLVTKRCVVPASGFFEWSHSGPKKKYQFNLSGSGVLYMAGLYQDFNEERRFIIITTAANPSMAEVHNRMPIVLQDAECDAWLRSREGAIGILRTTRPDLIKEEIVTG